MAGGKSVCYTEKRKRPEAEDTAVRPLCTFFVTKRQHARLTGESVVKV